MVIPSLLSKSLLEDLGAINTQYRDNHYEGDWNADMMKTKTLYIGNLSFYTGEEQLYYLFSRTGSIKRIIIGLHRDSKTPCGFCFVEYWSRDSCVLAKKYLDGIKLDNRFIRVDYDPGFKEGRQFGRGRQGGQVRDEMRKDYDSGRGGWGGNASTSNSTNPHDNDEEEDLKRRKKMRY